MTTVQNVLDFLQQLAPASMASDWDNVGLLLGRKDQPVSKILVALDPFSSVCQEAVQMGADLLVTHHPLIFHPLASVTDDTDPGKAVLTLAAKGISAINAHTNLDCAVGGVNDVLAERLGLENIQVISPAGTDEAGRPWGLLRMGEVKPQSVEEFLSEVKTRLGCQGLRYVTGGKTVCRVAVGGGSCGSELSAVFEAGCDTFVTADIRYNQFVDAQHYGINLIDAGHFHTENPICAVLAQQLQAQFPHICVELSKNHRDCIKFFP